MGLVVGPEGGVGVSLEACDAISMTHKKSGNVQDIGAALKKNASKDVEIGVAKNIHHYDSKEDSTFKS